MRTVAKIEKANCYFRITDFYGEFADKVIKRFCKAELTKFEMQKIPNTRHKIWKPTHVFARAEHDHEVYRMPLSVLGDFMKYAQYCGYNPSRIGMSEKPLDPSTKVEHDLKDMYKTPREHQVDWIQYQLGDGPLKVNNAATGQGKGLPLTARVKTPGGWLPVRDLEVGQTILTWDGTNTKINGVYPQGVQSIQRVTFEDGRSTDVDNKHMWEILDYLGPDVPGADTEPKRKVVDMDMLNEYISDPVRAEGLYIPLCKSEPLTHRFRMARLKEVMDKRWKLLRNGDLFWSSVDNKLTDEVVDLVRSIGGIAYYEGLDEEHVHHVRILVEKPEELIYGEFDRARVKKNAKVLLKPELKIRSVTSTGKEEETICISIDHPSKLFVVDDYIVTHNTYMGLFTGYKLETRVLITIQPRYIPVWQKDICEMFNVTKEDVVLWEFSDLMQLGKIISNGKINPKMVILPITRIGTYLKNQRKDPSMLPMDEIFTQIGAGLRIIDEAHESFHEIAVSMMYGNPIKTIILSATLKGDDPFMNKMYLAMIPKACRLKEPDDENYIDIVAFLYDIAPKWKLITQQNGSYSDIALEKSILKSEELTNFYFELSDLMYREFYLNVKEEGTKCLFFYTLIEMCQVMKEKFRERYPGEDFDTFLGTLDKKTPKKYMEHENLITTPGSCGTGKDIPGLVTAICPHTVFSTQRNKQIIGRLRNLLGKFGNRITPTFVFPVCKSIPKHIDCLAKRKIAFGSKQKTFRRQESGMAMAA